MLGPLSFGLKNVDIFDRLVTDLALDQTGISGRS